MTVSSDTTSLALPERQALIAAVSAQALYWAVSFVVSIVLFYGNQAFVGTVPPHRPGSPIWGISLLCGTGTAAWFARSRLRRLGWRAFRAPTLRDAGVYAGAVVAVAALYSLYEIIIRATGAHDVWSSFRGFSVRDPNQATVVLSNVLTLAGGCITVPLFEEPLFRALTFGGLIPRYGTLGAALISAMIFGAIHFDPLAFPLLTAFALIATASYALTRNLLVSMAVHATTNAVLLTTYIVYSLAGYTM